MTAFSSLKIVGALLPADLLGRVSAGDPQVPGTGPQTYGLERGESVRRQASRSWLYLLEVWQDFKRRIEDPDGGEAVSARVTRERWLRILLRELGFHEMAGGSFELEGKSFPVSHRAGHIPVHLLGWATDLDHKTPHVAARAPQSMLQELLNRDDAYLWAILSNGATLRLLRDSTALVGSSYVETFLAGCHGKADELDDSSGSFGQFAQDLICLWIKASQASGADADRTVSRLLAWMDDDPYAFCYEIEKDAAAAFDKAGLAAFEKQIRARFEAASAEQSGYPYRHWSQVLRAIYHAQRNVAAYVALAEQTGLTPPDCVGLARLLVARKPHEALAWVERGRALDRKGQFRSTAAYELDQIHRKLLTKLGRQEEAHEAAWADFRKDPSKYSYDDLMKLAPKAAHPEWHEKAMDAAKGADLDSLLDLFVHTKEIERLAGLVRGATDGALEEVSHYATEDAAKRLQKTHAGLAARLWRAQGMRIVDAKKSKYYDAAH